MLSFSFRILLLLISLSFYSESSYAVIIAKMIEVHLSIEDGDMHQAVITNVKFDHQDVDMSKKSFMHPKISKVFTVTPGQYVVEWTTEKNENPWGGSKETLKHSRALIFEMSDAVVYINIRGETIRTY